MSIHAIPRLPHGLMVRRRLSALLDSPAALVVLHAPAGYGKTVALAQWAAAARREGLWMRVRDGVGEPRAFGQQLSAELDDAGLLADDSPLRTAGESLAGGSDVWALLARGLRRLGRPFTLVLDEGELLAEESVAGILGLLMDLPGLSVRVASRRMNGFLDPSVRLALEVERLGTDHLALTRDEAAAIVRQRPDGAVVGQVLDEGAAPALARLVTLAGCDIHRPLSGGADALDRMLEALLRRRIGSWEPQLTEFVETLALSETVDAPLAAELTGRADAAALLDRVEAAGLGYWTGTTARSPDALFVFSPVFRRIVDRTARERIPGARLRELDRSIARWNLRTGRPQAALRGAVSCGDWALATEVAREYWLDLLRSPVLVRSVLNDVPPHTLRSHVLLAMLLALVLNMEGSQKLRSTELFLLAARGAQSQRATVSAPDRALLSAVESAALRVTGRVDAAARAATVAAATLRELAPSDLDRLSRSAAMLYSQVGLSFFYAGRDPEAIDCFRASAAVGADRGLLAGVQGLSQLAGVHAMAGNLPDAAAMAAAAERHRWPDGWQEGYPGSMYQLALSVLALERFDLDEAAARLATLDAHRDTIEHWLMLDGQDVLLRLMRGELESAMLLLERMENAHPARRLGRIALDQLRAIRVLVRLAHGDVTGAEKAIARMPPGPLRSLARARADLVGGDVSGVLRALASFSSDVPRLRAEHLALTAAAVACGAAEDGQLEVAGAATDRLFGLLEDRGMRLPLLLIPVSGLDALLAVARRRCRPTQAEALEGARRLAPIGGGRIVPALSGRELLVARALSDNGTVTEIAAALTVSPNTVKTQLRSVYRKLGVRTRDEALRVLAARGLIDPTAPPGE